MKTKKLLDIKRRYQQIEAMGTVYGSRNYVDSSAMTYHENSKLSPYSSRLFGSQIMSFNNEYYHARASQPYKIYNGKKQISLPEKNGSPKTVDLHELIVNRRSERRFSGHRITLEELYNLLHYSYGISQRLPIHGMEDGVWAYRNVPSAGSLYPLELYVTVLHGEMEPGLYHFRPDINALELIRTGDHYPLLNKIVAAEPNIDLKGCSCVVFITSVFERVLIKYGERGYRFLMMETGFVSQSITLLSEALGLGSCMAGGFQDDNVNSYLEIRGVAESVQNVIVIGKPVK